MKKVLTYLTSVLLAAGCAEMYGPEQHSTTPVLSDGIKIAVSEIKDNSFVLTLTPAGEASYYTYLVDKADKAQELDAETLYRGGYESYAVTGGTFKWSEKTPGTTVTVDGLDANAVYQIYAVAGSPTGVPSKVSVHAVTTTDSGAPKPLTFSFEKGVATVDFAESIVRGTEAVTVDYYAENNPAFQQQLQPEGTYTLEEEKIKVEGNKVSFTLDALPSGAFFTVSLASGAFKDLKGNLSLELKSGVKAGAQGPEFVGINGRADKKPFSIENIEATTFLDPSEGFLSIPSAEYPVAGMPKSASGVMIIKNAKKENRLALVAGENFGLLQDGSVMVAVPSGETLEKGDSLIFTVAAGSIVDLYGNGNAEWTERQLYSYGYTMADITGQYQALGKSDHDGQTYYLTDGAENLVVIAEDDTKEGYNVSISNILVNGSKIYANFDVHAGTLSIGDSQLLVEGFPMNGPQGPVEADVYFANYSDEAPVVMDVPEPGKIVSSMSWMYFLPDLKGFLDVFSQTQMLRNESGGPAPAGVRLHTEKQLRYL